jgi:hypothetical protein
LSIQDDLVNMRINIDIISGLAVYFLKGLKFFSHLSLPISPETIRDHAGVTGHPISFVRACLNLLWFLRTPEKGVTINLLSRASPVISNEDRCGKRKKCQAWHLRI